MPRQFQNCVNCKEWRCFAKDRCIFKECPDDSCLMKMQDPANVDYITCRDCIVKIMLADQAAKIPKKGNGHAS